MGKVEGHGEILQHMLERFEQDVIIDNDDQFKDALHHLCNAKNALSRTKGYSPEILECARLAFIQAESNDKLRKAFLRRQRPYQGRYLGGMFVMFWRPGRGERKGQWIGPARGHSAARSKCGLGFLLQ